MVWQVRESITLRPLSPAHQQELWLAVDASREHLRPWLPWVEAARGPEDIGSFIQGAQEEHQRGAAWHFAIIDDSEKEGNEVIGACGFNRISLLHRWASIGYWLRRDRWGQGIMLACVRTLLQVGISELNVHRLEIRCAEDNKRSRAIPERLGFRQEGVLRDCEWVNDQALSHVVYGLLVSEASFSAHHNRQRMGDGVQ
uniref:GNAT family N-acetyltransferase n=1 Tax=Halomonas sp. TaxID=1486246 RepID=UPI002628F315|nr:GNAT family N-acetyltransferase [Halomonas sp.]